MSTVSIGLILPEVLGTYGDDGNALVLRQRARMRGMSATIVTINHGQPVPDSLDIYCLGGGEDTAQILAARHLISDGGLSRAAAKGAPIFAICAGLQVLGVSFSAAGKTVDGVGLIDATTTSLSRRAIGELGSTPTGAGVTAGLSQPLIGFENHMGATVLGPDATALGTVTKGVGNLDEAAAHRTGQTARAEGAVCGSVIATYMHGPALARNPDLADLLLAKATGADLAPIDIDVVERLRAERMKAKTYTQDR